MAKIYTKQGDKGETSLVNGERVSKLHPRISAYGCIDELNSNLGVCSSLLTEEEAWKKDFLFQVQTWQKLLFHIGSQLACSDPRLALKLPDIQDYDIGALEEWMDQTTEQLPALENFILPGGAPLAAHFHVARCVCRRAERECLELQASHDLDLEIYCRFLNRLSDALFTAARYANFKLGVSENLWSV